MKTVKNFFAFTLIAFLFAFSASNVQAQCPGGTGCAACNAQVTAVNLSFRSGSTFYMAANKSICGSACSYASGAGSFEWKVLGCGYTINSQSNGFASITISGCAPGSNFSVCFRFLATTPGGTQCWSDWNCRVLTL